MEDVYLKCPSFENEKYRIRLLSAEDCLDLLEVYSDEKAVPFFNSDNCNGDDFHYTTEQRMKEAIDFWEYAYRGHFFVRFSIVDLSSQKAIGTIELFHRDKEEGFPECGLLRLDLRSDYEKEAEILSILTLILEPSKELFYCNAFMTKAIPEATERIKALKKLNFELSDYILIGQDGTVFGDYFLCKEY